MDIAVLIQKLEYFFQNYGLMTVFVGSFVEITPLGWLVPGGVILAIAGFFANGPNSLSLISIISFATIGAWTTFLFSYLLGRKTGMWLVKKLKQERNASFAKSLLSKHGGVILTTSMMANLTRFWVAYIAGVDKYHFGKFLSYSGVASLGWVSIMTLIGFFAGYERQNLEGLMGAAGIIGWLFLVIAGFILYKSIHHEYKHFKEDEPHEENN